MAAAWRLLLLVIIGVLILVQLTMAQNGESPAQLTVTLGGKTITHTEPGVWGLKELFKRADIVALVYVISGDTEAYEDPLTVYKAKVIMGFKGAAKEEILYFGPYTRIEVGGEYVLFLIKEPNPIAPKSTSSFSYGAINYAKVFDEGFSSMKTDYECVFDGKDTSQQCDYGVSICTDYIILPKSIRTYPPETENVPFGCRWVRRTVFISQLKELGKAKKP
jgi:hypothetical protein